LRSRAQLRTGAAEAAWDKRPATARSVDYRFIIDSHIMHDLGADHHLILGILSARGSATSQELQAVTGKSQPTVSRLIADLSARVLRLGKARATRYGLPKSIHGSPAQQPLWWTPEDGTMRRIGTLSFLVGDLVHVETDLVDSLTHAVLPWFLTPLKAQGFLGRLQAQRLAAAGIGSDPEAWSVESLLFAALHLHDAPGAISLGDPAHRPTHAPVPLGGAQAAALDALAADVARTLPAGSSAGGEQPKFLALLEDGRHALVKFSPPKGTPFGDRWGDLLHAESLASAVLATHGVAVAATTVVESAIRTYLVSERFDRIGARGRRHVVAVGAAHQAFIPGAYDHWAATCEALARQRRLPAIDAERAAALRHFGRLIGNTDMHAGNLGLLVRPEDVAAGRFALAPAYDMLPMRWRPDPVGGGAAEYTPFEPDTTAAASAAIVPARDFWQRLATHGRASPGLRAVAREMANRLGG
jgi:hypothetical protein